jgi:hypothetical protein
MAAFMSVQKQYRHGVFWERSLKSASLITQSDVATWWISGSLLQILGCQAPANMLTRSVQWSKSSQGTRSVLSLALHRAACHAPC